MSFNIKKCICISFSLKLSPIIGIYMLGQDILARVPECKYLGVIFSSNLSWSSHINQITKKAMNSLYAIQHSFRKSSRTTKQTLYFTLVRSLIEYACIVWDPSGAELVHLLGKIQRRAARFVLNRYGML